MKLKLKLLIGNCFCGGFILTIFRGRVGESTTFWAFSLVRRRARQWRHKGVLRHRLFDLPVTWISCPGQPGENPHDGVGGREGFAASASVHLWAPRIVSETLPVSFPLLPSVKSDSGFRVESGRSTARKKAAGLLRRLCWKICLQTDGLGPRRRPLGRGVENGLLD